MDIGMRIKSFREEMGISQDDLALKIFVSRQTISNWETNKSYPDIKSLAMLSNIFNVSLDDFIKGDIEKMRKLVDKEEIRKFNILSYVFSVEFLIVILSAYPLFCIEGYIGIVIWVVLYLITLSTVIVVERLKKKNDIQTYKEIIAFVDNKTLTYDESLQEKGKRAYQKFFLAIAAGLVMLVVLLIEVFIMKHI